MTRLRTLFAFLVCIGATALPRLAQACPVCSAGREDEAQRAFILTTIFLSVLPLAMFAGFGIFLWRRHRQRERSLAPAGVREPAAPASPSLPELS